MAAAGVAQNFESRRRAVGSRLGRYLVGPRVGVGGSAAVYLARAAGPSEARVVAVKVVHEHLAEEHEFINQFLDEANLLVRLAHPNIVQVYELGRDGTTLFLVMEHLDGQPLSKVVSALARRGERLEPQVVAWIGARIAEGLGYAHALKDEHGNSLGLVHRDISPQNVFVTYDGRVKLIDFGIARAAGRIAQTTLGRIKGKFSYMAPEQVLGRDFDHRVDLFALGATLYEAAAGGRLFGGMSETETLQKILFEEVPELRSRVKDFPIELATTIHKCLAGEPDERPQTGEELAKSLDAFLRASGSSDPHVRLAEVVRRAFEAERLEQQKSIESLKALADSNLAPLEDMVSGTHTLPAPPRRRRWLYPALGLGVCATIALGALALRTEPSAVPAPVVVRDVSIEVVTQPEVHAKIKIGDVEATGKPARAHHKRGGQAIEVLVVADGYEPAKTTVVPDRDVSLVVPLVKSVVPDPKPSASAAGPGEAPPKSNKPGGKPGTNKTGKPKDPLVTKYPF